MKKLEPNGQPTGSPFDLLLFGALSAGTGIRAAGWIITALVAIAGLTLTRIAARHAADHPSVSLASVPIVRSFATTA